MSSMQILFLQVLFLVAEKWCPILSKDHVPHEIFVSNMQISRQTNRHFNQLLTCTLPETNSKSPWKWAETQVGKDRMNQPSIFRGIHSLLVSGRVISKTFHPGWPGGFSEPRLTGRLWVCTVFFREKSNSHEWWIPIQKHPGKSRWRWRPFRGWFGKMVMKIGQKDWENARTFVGK